MPTRIENAKIACVSFSLNKFKLELGTQVLVDDPKNLEKIRQKECDILKVRIKKIIDAGANVIFSTKGIDDMAQKYLVEAGCIGCRRVTKEDMRRISKCTGATVIDTMATIDGEEAFGPSLLGYAKEVYEEAVGDNDFIFIKGVKNSQSATILIRGANEFMIAEVERSMHDALCVVKRTLESGNVVAGGGSVEMALNVHLEDYA